MNASSVAEMMLLDKYISTIRTEFSLDNLILIKSLPDKVISLGIPALLSALLSPLVSNDIKIKDKREIMAFIDHCICSVCSNEFLKQHYDKINILYERVFDALIVHDCSKPIERMLETGIEPNNIYALVLMFFVHYGTIEDFVDEDVEVLRERLDRLKKYNLKFESDTLSTRYYPHVLCGLSYFHQIPCSKYVHMTIPSLLLRVSPLVNDYDFYECTFSNVDMEAFFAKYTENKDILKDIVQRNGNTFINEERSIILLVEKRNLLPSSFLIENGCFTETIVSSNENFDLIVNQLIFTSKYQNSFDCFKQLLLTFDLKLSKYSTEILQLFDNFFSTYSDECSELAYYLVQKAQKHQENRKCSEAVLNYIQSVNGSNIEKQQDYLWTQQLKIYIL